MDLVNLERHLGEKENEESLSIAYKQVAYADVILLNKADLLSSEEDYTR